MGNFWKSAILTLLLAGCLPKAAAAAESLTDDCAGNGGCPFVAYHGLAPASPAVLAPGLGDSDSLALAGFVGGASYEISGVRQAEVLLYSRMGAFASYIPKLGFWTQGGDCGGKLQRMYWSNDDGMTLLADGSALYRNPLNGLACFYSDAKGREPAEYLGVNVAVSADGQSYRSVETELVSARSQEGAYVERYTAAVPTDSRWVRVTLRDYVSMTTYGPGQDSFPSSSVLHLGQVRFTGEHLISGGGRPDPPDPIPPTPPPSMPGAEEIPPPDIGGTDSVPPEEEAPDAWEEEESRSEKEQVKEPKRAATSKSAASNKAPAVKSAPKAGGSSHTSASQEQESESPLEESPLEEFPLEQLPAPVSRGNNGSAAVAVANVLIGMALVLLYSAFRKRKK